MTLGAQLKMAREGKGYTLKQLSEISGLSIGFISQVERGQTDPSLSSLRKLASALSVKLRDLLDRDTVAHVLVKRGEGSILKIDAAVSCELLASSLNKTMEPMIKFISPGGESGLVDPHPGEEFIWVIEGTLQVVLGETAYILNSGDSVY
ncbi:MAG: helix-turn-helix domain-containing protein, partial [Christensenellales bacterium]